MSRNASALILMWLGVHVVLGQVSPALADSDRQAERQALVRSLSGVAPDLMIDAPNVRAALLRVPRHRFVPDGLQDQAYQDKPVPIGHGQTISQPTVVALMTQLADVDDTHKVLEVGTGSGYQAAILAQLTDQVYTIEIIEPLAREAKARLANLGYNRIRTRQGDGYYGWPEQAPFDRIDCRRGPYSTAPAGTAQA